MEKLTRQEKGLQELSRFLGKEQNGADLYRKLRRLETAVNRLAEQACNYPGYDQPLAQKVAYTKKRIQEIFGKPIPGFFVNTDPRGYALKISDEIERNVLYTKGIYLERDMGGYALLAPVK
jgi:hypothetical protein